MRNGVSAGPARSTRPGAGAIQDRCSDGARSFGKLVDRNRPALLPDARELASELLGIPDRLCRHFRQSAGNVSLEGFRRAVSEENLAARRGMQSDRLSNRNERTNGTRPFDAFDPDDAATVDNHQVIRFLRQLLQLDHDGQHGVAQLTTRKCMTAQTEALGGDHPLRRRIHLDSDPTGVTQGDQAALGGRLCQAEQPREVRDADRLVLGDRLEDVQGCPGALQHVWRPLAGTHAGVSAVSGHVSRGGWMVGARFHDLSNRRLTMRG